MGSFAKSGLDLQLKNFNPFKDGLNQINKQVKSLNDNLLGVQSTFTELSQSVGKSTRSLTNLGNRIAKSETSLGKLSDRLERQNQLMLLGNRRSGTLGDGFDQLQLRTDKYSKDIRELSTQLLDSNNRLRVFQNTATRPGLDNLTDRVDRANRELGETPRVAQQATSKLKSLGGVAKDTAKTFDGFARGGLALATKGIAAFGVGAGVAFGATISIASDFQSAFTGVAKTVDGLTEISSDGLINLTEAGKEVRQEFIDLSNQIPATFQELSETAELGGQLGILEGIDPNEVDEVLGKFAATITGLEQSTNLTREAAATDLAQLSNIFKTELEELNIDAGTNIEKLGNTLVGLGNQSATTEAQILSFASRVAGAGKVVGLTQSDVLGIGAAFSSIGITAESGGTSVSRALLAMQESIINADKGFVDNTKTIMGYEDQLQALQIKLVQTEKGQGGLGESLVAQEKAFIEAGGTASDFGRQLGDKTRAAAFKAQKDINDTIATIEKLKAQQGQPISNKTFEGFLKVLQNTEKGANLTAESFKTLFAEDASEAFSLFVEGLGLEGENASIILDDLGLGSAEAQRTFLAMSQNADLLTKSMKDANDEFESGTALTDEVNQRYATLSSRVQIFRNNISNAAATIGDFFLPSITKLVSGFTPLVEVIGNRIPDVLTALGTKFAPVFEGLGLSLDSVDFTTILDDGFDLLITAIDSFDTTAITDSLTTLVDDIFPVINTGISFLVENWDLLSGTLLTAATVGGGIWVATAAIGTLTAAVGFLLSPIGVAIAAVTALSLAWETNFLGIQDTTNAFIEGFQDGGFSAAFENIGIPESVIESGQNFIDGFIQPIKDTIPTIQDAFSSITESITNLLSSPAFDFITEGGGDFGAFFTENSENIGEFLGVVIATPIEQVAGIIEVLSSFLDLLASPDTESITALTDSIIDFLAIPFDNFGTLFTGDPDFSILETIDETLTAFSDEWFSGFEGLLDLVDLGMPTWDFITVDDDLKAAWTQWSGIFDNAMTAIDLGMPTWDFITVDDDLKAAWTQWSGIFDNAMAAINLGLPSFDDTDTTLTDTLTEKATNLKNTFTDLLSDVDLGNLALPEIDIVGLLQTEIETITTLLDSLGSILDSVDFGILSLGEFELDLTPLNTIKDSVVEIVDSLSSILGEVDLGQISLGEFELDLTPLNTIKDSVVEIVDSLSSILGEVDLGQISIPEFDIDLTETATTLKTMFETSFSNILDEISLGVPKFDLLGLGASAVNVITGIQEAFTNILDDTDMGTPSVGGGLSFAVAISDTTSGIVNTFTGLLTDVDLGLPTFPDLITKAKETGQAVIDYFSGLLTGIDLGLPELPDFITELDLTPDFIFGGEDEAEQSGQDLGQAQQEGIAKGIEDGQDEPKGAIEKASEFMSSTWDSWWESESPSKVTELKGQDIMAGWALGLSDTTAVIAAIDSFNELLLTSFEALSELVMNSSLPSMQSFQIELTTLYQNVVPQTAQAIDELTFVTLVELINTFNTLNFETLPAYVSILLDQAIPATNSMGAAIMSLTSDVRVLIGDVSELSGVLTGQLVNALKKSTDSFKKTKTEGKALDKVIKTLTRRYRALAAAITEANNAGSGLTQPGPGTPIGLATGGSFIVPSQGSIPEDLRGPTGGMIIEVHASELVQVTPANQVDSQVRVPMENFIRPTATIKAPPISGAGIINNNTTTSDNSTKGDTFVLNVANPVESGSVISSFRLMENLARV